MKKQIIRLTEDDLHQIIENSVKRILKEGQGWATFKNAYKKLKQNPQYYRWNDDKRKKDILGNAQEKDNYIKYGNIYGFEDKYYNPETGHSTYVNNDMNKPVNRGLTGRLGRRAAYSSLNGLAKFNNSRLGRKIFGSSE